VFGIGFEELIILAILAFILFGPEKLPDYAATLGKFIAKMRQTSSELTQQYQNPFQTPSDAAPRPAPESVCPHCQHKVTQDYTFCPECGQRVTKDHYPPPAESACPYCRQKVDLDAIFCSKCGHRLKEEDYPPQQPQAS
jgi:Sec-independent protein translocase protein TatA